MTYYLELENVEFEDGLGVTPLEYHFPVPKEFRDTKSKDFLAVGAPQTEDSVQFGLVPPTEEIPVNFLIVNTGEDVSNGTWADSGLTDANISDGTVTTVAEQVYYLKNYITTGVLGAQWRLYGTDFGGSSGTPVANAQIQIVNRPDRFNSREASMTLQVGDVV